ncbi:hypothetical protein GCM10010124_15900 [Pilimelia terevasa]|uniref:ARB-07466-like C-terminal domain-containing protein n=1 Tax=Pilimelia terevasa TaxID=53372 RepID=A0A8J3FJL2_9ACTN|nr:hypothetical protein [Pilimelia terevasa]GGK24220.1 hypothetical protein GCM10010124_15900 [Pilimelia terevasa]
MSASPSRPAPRAASAPAHRAGPAARAAGAPRRWAALAAALLLAATAVGSPAAAAAPDPEGGTAKLRKVLDEANRGFVSAKTQLTNSQRREKQLQQELRDLAGRQERLAGTVKQVAARSYRSGPLTGVSMMLESDSPDAFWVRATAMDRIFQLDAARLAGLVDARREIVRAQAQLDGEITVQTKQVAQMKARTTEAEQALIAAGGGGAAGGFLPGNSPLAKPARRNPDGSWPNESCNVDDPTTGGCITPRTLHAMQQAKSAGFTRFVSCHRGGGGGEHPKGRACDFAAAKGGFANVDASGGDRAYGDRLAGYYVKNAGRLGVLYVIWYRQIWMPSTGWRAYSGGGGPSGTHTNHVHLSMQ